MKNFILAALIIPSVPQYQKQLVHEIATIIRQHKECTQSGYDTIYKNIALMSMFNNDFNFRYEATMALRERCHGMLSSYEK